MLKVIENTTKVKNTLRGGGKTTFSKYIYTNPLRKGLVLAFPQGIFCLKIFTTNLIK